MSEIKQFVDKLSRYRMLIESEKERILTTAAFSVLAEMQDRIFDRGEAADGSKIGAYSSDETWIKIPITGVSNSKLKKKGKPKGKPKKSKETKETMYFKNGYSQFRKTVGRQNKNVDLSLTGSLSASIIVGKKNDSIVIGIASEDNVEKAEGNEKRYSKTIFALSNEEKLLFLRIINREIEKINRKIFG